MINLYTGNPGQGKSLILADICIGLLARNARWAKKNPNRRRVAVNFPIADWVHEEYPGDIVQWESLDDLMKLHEVDVLWDEVANQLDSNDWANLSIHTKSWLRHHEKHGVDIYADTQNFMQVDVQFRRLVDQLYFIKKLIGSRRPAATKPAPSWVWGLIWIREVDKTTFSDTERKNIGTPDWLWISKKLVSVYDTKHLVNPGLYPPLQHKERHCPTCGKTHIIHS